MTEGHFRLRDDADHPGWFRWDPVQSGLFNELFGLKLVRRRDTRRAQVRFFPADHHRNVLGTLHGGALLSFVDISLSGAILALEIENAVGMNTLDLTAQFMAPGRSGVALDVEVEILRSTGRFIFTRGLFEQDGQSVLGFTAVLRKPGRRA